MSRQWNVESRKRKRREILRPSKDLPQELKTTAGVKTENSVKKEEMATSSFPDPDSLLATGNPQRNTSVQCTGG